MRFGVLGPLLIVDDAGRPRPVTVPQHRRLLATLLLRANQAVSFDDLADLVWDGHPPAGARATLRNYMRLLRQAVGPDVAARLITRAPGYVLEVGDDEVDLHRFLVLCERGWEALRAERWQDARSDLVTALDLWRGDAFADVDLREGRQTNVPHLAERRLQAVEWRIEADLQLGRQDGSTAELQRLVESHPLRERFWEQLMLALYRAGRQSDALLAYQKVRGVLHEELGIEPGLPLQAMQRQILNADPALLNGRAAAVRTDVGPAELPAPAGHFTGRRQETDRLSSLVDEAHRQKALPVIVVVGPPGVGKTAFTVHWAHRAIQRFPDGQIFLDLLGFSVEPAVSPAAALPRLLRSLGVDASRVPDDADEAAALYRSMLSGKRVLIVLDNVVSASQLFPLLPGGPGNTVVVTSRNRLPGLTARNGAHHLVLEALPAGESFDLINRIVGPDRIAAESDAARELALRCGNLPLALCIAAANLADDHTRTVAGYLANHQAGGWMATLGISGDPDQSVKAAFDLSLRALTERQQALLTLLGLVPGPNVTAASAAALADRPPGETEADLRRLAQAHLIQSIGTGRFAFHDLIREYARDRLETCTPAERAAATARLYTFYWDAADAADLVLQPGALRLSTTAGRVAAGPRPTDEHAARTWFADEIDNLVEAILSAAATGPQTLAVQLADAVGGYLWIRRDLPTWAAVAEAASRAARDTGDIRAQAAAEIALAKIADCRCDYPQAVSRLGDAIGLARRSGWQAAEAVALGSLAALNDELGDTLVAERQLKAALVVSRQAGARLQQGRTLVHLGIHQSEQGHLQNAYELFETALELIEAQGSRIGRAIILNNLAQICILRRNFDEAAERADEALHICDQLGHVSSEIAARVVLSAASRGRDDTARAARYAAHALTTAAPIGDAYSLAIATHEIAAVYDATGEPSRAIEHHRTAHRLTAGIKSRFADVEYSIALAVAEHRLPRTGPGAGVRMEPPELRHALNQARASGYRGLEGAALAAFAERSRDAGSLQDASRYAQQALAIQREAGWRSDGRLLATLILTDDDTLEVHRLPPVRGNRVH